MANLSPSEQFTADLARLPVLAHTAPAQAQNRLKRIFKTAERNPELTQILFENGPKAAFSLMAQRNNAMAFSMVQRLVTAAGLDNSPYILTRDFAFFRLEGATTSTLVFYKNPLVSSVVLQPDSPSQTLGDLTAITQRGHPSPMRVTYRRMLGLTYDAYDKRRQLPSFAELARQSARPN